MPQQVYSSKNLKLIKKPESWITKSIKKNMEILIPLSKFKMTLTFLKINFWIINSTNKMKLLPISWATIKFVSQNRNKQMRSLKGRTRQTRPKKTMRMNKSISSWISINAKKRSWCSRLSLGAVDRYQIGIIKLSMKSVKPLVKIMKILWRPKNNSTNRFSLKIIN